MPTLRLLWQCLARCTAPGVASHRRTRSGRGSGERGSAPCIEFVTQSRLLTLLSDYEKKKVCDNSHVHAHVHRARNRYERIERAERFPKPCGPSANSKAL